LSVARDKFSPSAPSGFPNFQTRNDPERLGISLIAFLFAGPAKFLVELLFGDVAKGRMSEIVR
jgi:hypothetical protein